MLSSAEHGNREDKPKAFTLSKHSPLHFLDITRSYKPDRSVAKKARLFGEDGFKEDGFKLTPELDAYRFIAGYNAYSFGALTMLINPELVDLSDNLGLVEALSVIIPIAIVSEMLNKFLYQRSLLENGSLVHGTNDLILSLFNKNYEDIPSQLAFTALWALYQVIRVPVITLAILSALVLWIPKMILGALASSLVLITRPLWYPIVSYVNEKIENTSDKPDENNSKLLDSNLEGKEQPTQEESKGGKSRVKSELRDSEDEDFRLDVGSADLERSL